MCMKYTMEQGKQLIDELIELWIETKLRCDKIEELVKQLKDDYVFTAHVTKQQSENGASLLHSSPSLE